MQILELRPNYFADVIALANQIHGDNYLTQQSLLQMQQQGIKQGINASFVALNEQGHIIGYRLSFAAGQWQPDKWCSVSLWPVAVSDMAYFKSVGVSPAARGQGVASALLRQSAVALSEQGAKAGLAHIWRESPGNAAERYFSHAGARLLKVHAERWRHLSELEGYICPRCGTLCRCSAAEMVLLLSMGKS
ncbi:GNAT family N-acetyltransferase [Rheinheimera nanhaiensis]|uniref:Acetyltransferase, GNAT family protein n=1 Tax=Rheinheimera nanhaiensis E407-8 TaxID=562729 RepID=I1DYU1_9GAMM|nr:GNAT family N-acetyltransferase [Rheinheimera nanhaiensis]GAB59219.1 acetyltransferase, GNAT family protein [Rheinheimera nanhaiensis E407-8]